MLSSITYPITHYCRAVHIRLGSAEGPGPLARSMCPLNTDMDEDGFQSNLLCNLSINEAPDLVFQTPGLSESPTADPSLPLLSSLPHDHNTRGTL